jgi:hypothetical protein
MAPEGVRQALVQEPHLAKEIALNDGTRLVVRSNEQWLVAAHALIVLGPDGFARHVAFRNITYIRFMKRNGQKRKKRA